MSCVQDSLGDVALDGGRFVIYFSGSELVSVNVPRPDLTAEKNRDSVVENDDEFTDPFGNSYSIYIYSSMYGIDYTIDATEIVDKEGHENFCENLQINFISNSDENELKDEIADYNSGFINYVPNDTEDVNIFSIRFSKPADIAELNEYYKGKLTRSLSIPGLTRLLDKAKVGDVVFIIAGGDKTKIPDEHLQGLYGVARILGIRESDQALDVQFQYYFEKVITREDLSSYPKTYDVTFIGPLIQKNAYESQAIALLSREEAKNILEATIGITQITKQTLVDIFPWILDRFNYASDKKYSYIKDKMPPVLNVKKIAKVFASFVMDYSEDETETMIGIFGRWGRGKTFFYEEVEKYIKKMQKIDSGMYSFCSYIPWKYQTKESAWAYLYETLLNAYLLGPEPGNSYKMKVGLSAIVSKAWKIFKLNIQKKGWLHPVLFFSSVFLASLWAFVAIEIKISIASSIIASASMAVIIYLVKIYFLFLKYKNSAKNIYSEYSEVPSFSNILGLQHEIHKELVHLLKAWFPDNSKNKLILFVDDLDRCEENLLIEIIDSLRTMLHNQALHKRLLVIIAVDERILLNAVEKKYHLLKEKVDAKEYIQKFFLLGIQLDRLSNDDIRELAGKYFQLINQKELEIAQNSTIITKEKKDAQTNESNSKNEQVSPVNSSLIVDMTEKIEEESIDIPVIKKEEIDYFIDHLKNHKDLTPRKINMYIHRYLFFKNLAIELLSPVEFKNIDYRLFSELLIRGMEDQGLNKLYDNIVQTSAEMIDIPFDGFSGVIKKLTLLQLIKATEMVSPF